MVPLGQAAAKVIHLKLYKKGAYTLAYVLIVYAYALAYVDLKIFLEDESDSFFLICRLGKGVKIANFMYNKKGVGRGSKIANLEMT